MCARARVCVYSGAAGDGGVLSLTNVRWWNVSGSSNVGYGMENGVGSKMAKKF